MSETSVAEIQAPNINLVPGASVLGFGINIARASGPSDVTSRIVNIDETKGTPVTEGGVSYLLPANVNLVDIHTGTVTYNTFSSRNEFSEHMAVETQVEASGWGFTGEFDAAYSSLTESKSASAYGLVEANTTLWSLSVQELQAFSLDPTFKADLAALPPAFSPSTQQAFFDLFNKYGTHVVSTSIVGGYLHYVTAVSSSSKFDTTTAEANMSLEYKSVFVDTSVTAKAEWEKIDKSWFASRSAQLMIAGGNPSILATAVPPDDPNTPVNFQPLVEGWTTSVQTTPAVIGLRLQAISHVAPTEQGRQLDKALFQYLNSSARGYSQLLVDLPTVSAIEGACAISIGAQNVTPPNVPTKNQLSMYWVVMADDQGVVKFNSNSLSNNPDDFDNIVRDAQRASQGQTWWTVVVVATTPPRPVSEKAMAWMESCGIALKTWVGYPNWPVQLSAVGMSNSPQFEGKFSMDLSPYDENPEVKLTRWEQTVETEIPLYVTI